MNTNTGYLYKTTHNPTGLMYFGSRKLRGGEHPDNDGYFGSPKGTNRMLSLLKTRKKSEFGKEVLLVSDYDEVRELEELLILEAWDKFGKDNVCNMAVGKAIDFTPEVRALMSKRAKGSIKPPRSEEYRLAMSKKYKGVTPPTQCLSAAAEVNARPVINTETGEEWASITEAGISEGVTVQAIYRRIKTEAYGGIWQYKEEQ